MNRRLFTLAESLRPDLMFFVLFKDEFEAVMLDRLRKELRMVTMNWFCDDHWRFDNFSWHWASHFSWITTTDRNALEKYRHLGQKNVILTQWGVNHFAFRKLDVPLLYDVSFVGQPHGNRREIVESLSRSGLRVQTWGQGWPNGRLSYDELVKVFNQSRINLNMSNASRHRLKFWEKRRDQIKGRNFEIPGCGGFQLSSYVEGIDEFFKEGEEIALFRDETDLLDKIRYYLENQLIREAVAGAGYRRTLADHTYQNRFERIFRVIFG